MNIKPTGHHVLIELEELKETFEGSDIIRPDLNHKKEQNGGQFAKVLEVGPTAWDGERPWAQVGDRVVTIRYPGAQYDYDGADKLKRIINDDEIIGVVTNE